MSAVESADARAEKEAVRALLVAAEEARHADLYPGRRETTRYAADVRLEVRVDGAADAEVIPAMLHNIGAPGMAFWTRQPIAVEPPVHVRAFSPDASRPWIGADVTHCTRGMNGCLVGVTFHHPLAPEEMPTVHEPQAAQDEEEMPAESEPAPERPARRGLLSRLGFV